MSDVTISSGGIRSVKARVRREGQLETFSVAVNEFENVSARSRLSFTWTIVPANFGNAETLLLVQNDNSSLTLHIEETTFQSDAATAVQVHLTDRVVLTPTGGTLVTGVCLNQTAPRVAEAIARSNETANAQGNIVWNFPIPAATIVLLEWHGAIILAKGQSVAIDVTTGPSSLASCSIAGFYAIPDEERT